MSLPHMPQHSTARIAPPGGGSTGTSSSRISILLSPTRTAALAFNACPLPATVSRSPLGDLEACVFAIPRRRTPAPVEQLIFKNAHAGIARPLVAKLAITGHRKIRGHVRARRAQLPHVHTTLPHTTYTDSPTTPRSFQHN